MMLIKMFFNFCIQEEEEARRADEIAKAAAAAEARRLEAEREEREKRRQESELQAIKDRNFKEKMQQISQTAHGQKVLKKLNEDVSLINEINFFCLLLQLRFLQSDYFIKSHSLFHFLLLKMETFFKLYSLLFSVTFFKFSTFFFMTLKMFYLKSRY